MLNWGQPGRRRNALRSPSASDTKLVSLGRLHCLKWFWSGGKDKAAAEEAALGPAVPWAGHLLAAVGPSAGQRARGESLPGPRVPPSCSGG